MYSAAIFSIHRWFSPTQLYSAAIFSTHRLFGPTIVLFCSNIFCPPMIQSHNSFIPHKYFPSTDGSVLQQFYSAAIFSAHRWFSPTIALFRSNIFLPLMVSVPQQLYSAAIFLFTNGYSPSILLFRWFQSLNSFILQQQFPSTDGFCPSIALFRRNIFRPPMGSVQHGLHDQQFQPSVVSAHQQVQFFQYFQSENSLIFPIQS